MAHFNREVIPERRMHAKGSGAFGTFTVTGDITRYTRAKVFSDIGKQTEVFARFSTVAGERGAADAERDIRGFAVKLYTEEGNWDLVGNNIEFGMFVLSSGLPQIRAGKVIALGTTEAKRSAITPDIPALSELPQYKNVDINVWFALMAPKGLPAPVAAKVKKALDETMASPEFRKKMEEAGSGGGRRGWPGGRAAGCPW